jgi:hypothetical protein
MDVKKHHNVMGQFVMNLRKCHKSMCLISNMLIHDENIVSVIDSAFLRRFHETSLFTYQEVSCSVTLSGLSTVRHNRG